VIIDGKARGIIVRDLVTGELERHFGHAVLLCTGGYGNVFYLSTNAMGCNVTAIWKAHRKGAYFGNPCFTQIHPTCIPVSGDHQSKLTLMSESLRNDGRIWVSQEKDDDERPAIFQRTNAIITWKDVILLLETWFRAMWHRGQPKKDATLVMAWVLPNRPCISIMRLP
jgi:succinate dehydrogenase / fumarate reductase flavoprotein subunit